jgi:hypothetical protein
VDEDVVVAGAAVSTVDLPEITPDRSRHRPDNPMVGATSIATDPCQGKQTLTFRQGRAMDEGAEDDSAPPLSLAVVLAQHHLALHLLPHREGLHAVTPQVNTAAVVLQSIGPRNAPRNPTEENAGAVMHRLIREDAHHPQSEEETQALLPNQDAIAHVHHQDLDQAAMIEMARLASLHHAVDAPLRSPKTDRPSVLILSRTVTPLVHADPIAAAVDNVLEAAPEMPRGVRHL